METFEIKDLMTVKGKSGLWRLVAIIKATTGGRMIRVKNLVDEKQVATVKYVDAAAIKNYVIYLKDGELSLERAIDNMLDAEDKGLVTREDLNSFDNLPTDKKEEMMGKVVPNYDPEKFKHYHFSKMIKWYMEIVKALDILNAGIEDPYKEDETSKTEEA